MSTKYQQKCKPKPKLNIDRVLLGPLTQDTAFLKGLINNNRFIAKKKNVYGEEVTDVVQDEVKKLALSFSN